MKSYLSLVGEYAKVHKKKNRLTVICIAIAVMLVTAVFGMADMSVQAQINEQIRLNGHYHIMLGGLSDDEARQISGRGDVKVSGWIIETAESSLEGKELRVMGGDRLIAEEMNLTLIEGRFPETTAEAMIDKAAGEQFGYNVGDAVDVRWDGGETRTFTISGIYNDTAALKRTDEHGLYLSLDGIRALPRIADRYSEYYVVQFGSGVHIRNAIIDLTAEYSLDESEIAENLRLIGLLGHNHMTNVMQIYYLSGVLSVLVLLTGIFMISSSFNMGVMERTQFFGMLRCLGATKRQIKRYIRLEGLRYCLYGVPAGLLAGCGVMWIAAFILKYGNAGFFSDIPLFMVSWPAMLTGAGIGILTVMLASRSPANKAAKVSPQAAVTGYLNNASVKDVSNSANTKRFRVDTAMGVSHAFMSKKSLAMVSGTFAISIILFLSFSVVISFIGHAFKPLQPYAADIALLGAEDSVLLERSLADELRAIPGVRNVYGRMFMYAIPIESGGSATLISFDETQFGWFREKLLEGSAADAEHGSDVLAIYSETNELNVGDTLKLGLPGGSREVTVSGLLAHAYFDVARGDQVIVCSEPTFTALTGISDYTIIDMQVDEDVSAEVRTLITPEIQLINKLQDNSDSVAANNTMSLFVYGFLAVIAFVALINIVNTVNSGVSSRISSYGVMRAVGMSGRQIRRTVTAEAAVYAAMGSLAGCALGLPLNWFLYDGLVTLIWGTPWQPPLALMAVTVLAAVLVTLVAVVAPTKKLREMSVVDVVNAG